MEELHIGKIIICKQKEDSENFEKFIEIVERKNINVELVKVGDRVNFEKNLYMDILWPSKELEIMENPLNNNSIVGKLVYKNFSMLFTGDIEEIAEKSILDKYSKNLEILKSDVLKVAHHGSRTSSNKEFVEAISPRFSVIGVGKNNNFGHPSKTTIDTLLNINSKIYRTDKDGEITIKTNGN